MISNIVLYLVKKQMSKTQAKKFTFKFVPYLFIAVTTKFHSCYFFSFFKPKYISATRAIRTAVAIPTTN